MEDTGVSEHVETVPSRIVHLGSMPNLRKVFPEHAMLYRSSRPDFITEGDHEKIRELGIRTVVDFRSAREYTKAKGEKLLDTDFDCVAVQLPGVHEKPGEVNYSPIHQRNRSTKNETSNNPKKHYFIDFFRPNYVWAVFKRAPLFIRITSLFFLLVDIIFKTHYFVKYYAKHVINDAGLVANYIDMLELSQRQIYAALKIISDRNNLPALINCAHGKDRTGIFVALLQKLVGMSREAVCEDYALSETLLAPIRSRVHDEIVKKFDFSEDFISARPETMASLLDYIDEKYGSVESYLISIGFTQEDQDVLRKYFLLINWSVKGQGIKGYWLGRIHSKLGDDSRENTMKFLKLQ
ncbi:uncharacterized protein LOC100370490 [Saccoglossus kowalevskii]